MEKNDTAAKIKLALIQIQENRSFKYLLTLLTSIHKYRARVKKNVTIGIFCPVASGLKIPNKYMIYYMRNPKSQSHRWPGTRFFEFLKFWDINKLTGDFTKDSLAFWQFCITFNQFLKHIWWFSSTFYHVEAILTLFKRRRKTPANLTVRSHFFILVCFGLTQLKMGA